MAELFYILFFISIILNSLLFLKINKLFKMMEIKDKYTHITGTLIGIDYTKFSKSYKPQYLVGWNISSFSMLVFSAIGILSSNWILFLGNLLLFLCLSAVLFLSENIKNFKYSKLHYLIFLTLTLAIILNSIFITINFFHLKINIYDYLKK